MNVLAVATLLYTVILWQTLHVVTANTSCTLVSTTTIRVFETVTIDVFADVASFANPFDYSANVFQGTVFSTSQVPHVSVSVVDAFVYQPFNVTFDATSQTESLHVTGPARFRLYYVPSKMGSFLVNITLVTPSSRVAVCTIPFSVTPSASPKGFIRVAEDRQHFVTDSGETIFLVGENMAWASGKGVFDYVNWIPKLAQNGGNFIRLWCGPFDLFSLETKHSGLMHYDLGNAWNLDYVLELAMQNGIMVEFTMESYNPWAITASAALWSDNPYNQANGGPLRFPSFFFSDATVIAMYENRLRYLIARYAHFTNVVGFQFFNEVDLTEDAWLQQGIIAEWHRVRANFFRRLDPYAHLLTTSFSYSAGWEAIQADPAIDYISTHMYDHADFGQELIAWNNKKWMSFKKPHYMEEMGIGSGDKSKDLDPTGIVIHNGLWSSIASMAAGGGCVWWWDSVTDPLNLYDKYDGFRKFTDLVVWSSLAWTPSDVDGLDQKTVVGGTIAGFAEHASVPSVLSMWFRNANYSWTAQDKKMDLNAIPAFQTTFHPVEKVIADLSWRVTWYATETAAIVAVTSAVCTVHNGSCQLQVPGFSIDVAGIGLLDPTIH